MAEIFLIFSHLIVFLTNKLQNSNDDNGTNSMENNFSHQTKFIVTKILSAKTIHFKFRKYIKFNHKSQSLQIITSPK